MDQVKWIQNSKLYNKNVNLLVIILHVNWPNGPIRINYYQAEFFKNPIASSLQQMQKDTEKLKVPG